MKKRNLLPVFMCAAMLCSCDPGSTTTVYIENDTGQEVRYRAYGIPKGNEDDVTYDEVIIGSHSRNMIGVNRGINGCTSYSAAGLLDWHTDSICITSGGHTITFYRDSALVQPHSPYHYDSFHLENHKKHMDFSTSADAVYVITDEDISGEGK